MAVQLTFRYRSANSILRSSGPHYHFPPGNHPSNHTPKFRTLSPLVLTGDGSHTIFDPTFEATYHSTNGAITESRHVFIEKGLVPLADKPSVSVLEVGYGTGLNAFLTFLFVREHPSLSVKYTGIEKYPLSEKTVAELNYVDLLQANSYANCFFQMHTDHKFETTRFNFDLFAGDISDFETTEVYHLVYFDAFAPNIQPEMWSQEILQRIKDCMVPGGILVTYSAQGQFRRTLKQLGFDVERLPGPPGKREMVRATLI